MKIIEKKSTVKVDKTSGSIVDTTNIEDKTTNTYSARIIDEKTNIVDLSSLITNKNSAISNPERIRMIKNGNIINLQFNFTNSKKLSQNEVLFKIPLEYIPKISKDYNQNLSFCGFKNQYDFAVYDIVYSTGELRYASPDNTNSEWVGAYITYICD